MLSFFMAGNLRVISCLCRCIIKWSSVGNRCWDWTYKDSTPNTRLKRSSLGVGFKGCLFVTIGIFFTSFRLSFMLLFHMREAVTYSSAPLSVVLFILQLTYRDTHSHTGICFVLFSLDVPTWEQPGALHMNGLSWSEFITLANFSYNYKNRENIHSSDIK